MKDLIKKLQKLFPGKSFSEENLGEELAESVKDLVESEKTTAVAKAVADAMVPLEANIKEMEPFVAEGKAYRMELVEKYATNKTKIGDVDEKPETRERTMKIAEGFGIDFLKAELVILDKRVAEKFPATAELKGEDPERKRASGGEKVNPLIPKEDK